LLFLWNFLPQNHVVCHRGIFAIDIVFIFVYISSKIEFDRFFAKKGELSLVFITSTCRATGKKVPGETGSVYSTSVASIFPDAPVLLHTKQPDGSFTRLGRWNNIIRIMLPRLSRQLEKEYSNTSRTPRAELSKLSVL
jgi:hypothetical protein